MGTTPDTTGDNPYFIRLTLEMGTRKYANAKCDRIRKSEIIADLCQKRGLKLVTDDGDFASHGLPIVTANRRLLR